MIWKHLGMQASLCSVSTALLISAPQGICTLFIGPSFPSIFIEMAASLSLHRTPFIDSLWLYVGNEIFKFHPSCNTSSGLRDISRFVRFLESMPKLQV